MQNIWTSRSFWLPDTSAALCQGFMTHPPRTRLHSDLVQHRAGSPVGTHYAALYRGLPHLTARRRLCLSTLEETYRHYRHQWHVPDVYLRLRCSACGSRNVKTQPDWREGEWARNYGNGRKG